MKQKILQRDLQGENVVVIPYGRLQEILNAFGAYGYHSGVYGWNYDCYYCKGIVFVTGYRPLLKWKKLNIDFCRDYDKRALKIIENTENWETRKMRLIDLLCEIADKAKRGEIK